LRKEFGRIGKAFADAASEDRAAFVVYATAGFPDPGQGLAALLAIADAGADVIELGVPFSDPLADGPTIQKASFAVIEQGVDLRWTLELLRRFRAIRETAVVIFSYLNPILDYGVESFIADATAAGADGVLLTDLPTGADPDLEALFEDSRLDLVRLIAPTTTPERMARIAARSQGFAYYISRTGVTGMRRDLAAGLADQVRMLKECSPVPVAVGFGISTPEQAATVAAVADGIVVGAAVVDALGRDGIEAGGALVASLRAALTRHGTSTPGQPSARPANAS
jgi:tryptophan synthase alpha chain